MPSQFPIPYLRIVWSILEEHRQAREYAWFTLRIAEAVSESFTSEQFELLDRNRRFLVQSEERGRRAIEMYHSVAKGVKERHDQLLDMLRVAPPHYWVRIMHVFPFLVTAEN
jgi:hypothetical protein